MNESPKKPTDEVAESRQKQRFVRWLLFALFASSLFGVASLATGITSYRSRTDSSGTTTTFTHHTVRSRVVLSAVTAFQVVLALGLIRRSRIAWRAAFALPLLWAFLVAIIAWPQLYTTSPDWSVSIPLACIVGIGIWNTIVWRRQWTVCECLFR